jgi:hypothetical protein
VRSAPTGFARFQSNGAPVLFGERLGQCKHAIEKIRGCQGAGSIEGQARIEFGKQSAQGRPRHKPDSEGGADIAEQARTVIRASDIGND